MNILYMEQFSQLVSVYIAIDILGVRSQNSWKFGRFVYKK